jgi:Na+(H+)/acetate symporter ActP
MVATTHVQIIKASLRIGASSLRVMLVGTLYGFSMPAFLEAAVGNSKIRGTDRLAAR